MGKPLIYPPGELIAEEIEARGWSREEFSQILGVSHTTVSRIINGKMAISPNMAHRLGQAFGTSALMWARLDADYQVQISTAPTGVKERAKAVEKSKARRSPRSGAKAQPKPASR